MNKTPGSLNTRIKQLQNSSIIRITRVFGRWIRLPEGFGHPRRKRLFFSLTGVLVVSLSGTLNWWFMQGSGETVPCMDRNGELYCVTEYLCIHKGTTEVTIIRSWGSEWFPDWTTGWYAATGRSLDGQRCKSLWWIISVHAGYRGTASYLSST